ncbi:hypothetical protein NEOLEDRAFT_1171296 [Neolentinus lepideus HHB14362 ss-1]|uniref:G-protein coupled receptors family 1 profile domain-containing protein n=1 Tax=Neolentinus lepideus HHB14362 ss-1 TaxID=1314782 RepID=A0A165QLN6_9AGAM|nr:hypothetical protein NEOLEDRAFT_1171296 [Neolentinus lepideus HHB14362 ss-1]
MNSLSSLDIYNSINWAKFKQYLSHSHLAMSSTDGVICSLQEMEESKTPSDRLTIHCLTRGQTIGLVFSLEGAFLSLGVLLMLFVFILRNYLRRRHHHHDASSLLHLPTDVFVLSLLLFCLIYSLSNAVDVKWINEGKFYIGKPCMAQGLLHLIGDLGVPSNMLVIDIHTFSAIWWQNSHLLSVRAALIISCILWMTVCSFTMGFAAVNSGGGRIFACPTPISCTVSVQFTAEKHLESATLIWMWIVVIISIVIYIPLYLLRRGNITTDEKSWWKESTTLSQDSIPTGITYFTQVTLVSTRRPRYGSGSSTVYPFRRLVFWEQSSSDGHRAGSCSSRNRSGRCRR